jgi:hypothetical protein
MTKLIVCFFTFIGSWFLSYAYFPGFKNVVFHIGQTGITGSIIFSVMCLMLAMNLHKKS